MERSGWEKILFMLGLKLRSSSQSELEKMMNTLQKQFKRMKRKLRKKLLELNYFEILEHILTSNRKER